MATSEYSDLYKNGASRLKQKQNQRRQSLLAKQKEQRSKDQDTSRNIDKLVRLLKERESTKANNHIFRNYIQLSEWLHGKPEDFENWFMVPCPKGKRCIAVATDHSTKIYNKFGIFQKEFCSGLPGNQYPSRGITILDCFEVTSNDITKYMVVDVMNYAYTDMINCETSLRFYWTTTKLPELQMEDVHSTNEFAFEPLNYVDCGDEIAMNACLTSYPMWNDENLQLDGFLFYHKESSYVHGETPLVGWLFSFMIRETLGYCDINPKYLENTPADYINASTYIDAFDRKKKCRRKKHYRIQRMEEGASDESDTTDSILHAEKTLEVEGEMIDDFGEEDHLCDPMDGE